LYWDDFEWDEVNEDHIAKHNVDRYEAEEAATDPSALIWRQGKDRFGSPRHLCIGKTDNGRILFLVVDHKEKHLWRVGAARDTAPSERKIYKKRS